MHLEHLSYFRYGQEKRLNEGDVEFGKSPTNSAGIANINLTKSPLSPHNKGDFVVDPNKPEDKEEMEMAFKSMTQVMIPEDVHNLF